MKKLLTILTVLCCAATTTAAQEAELKIPSEVASFVEAGTKAIALEKADLNGDGRADFILVLERENPETKDDFPVNQRPLLILTREADKSLKLATRNERVVMCSQCGGIWGDPFEGVTAAKNSFTVNHYGGSNWRWYYRYRFNYSRIDKTWQLVRAEEGEFHTAEPNKGTHKVFTPPKHFGKIDAADFDPENYKKKGVK